MDPSYVVYSTAATILFYLKYISFDFALVLTIPQALKIYRKELKFYHGPLVFLFFCLAEYLVSLGLVAFRHYYIVAPGLFIPTIIFLFAIIITMLFIDPETPKKYSFIALGIFLGLSLFIFLFPLMINNTGILISIFRLIYSSGSIECTVLALINKKHDIIPVFIYIPLIFHNIFGFVIYFVEYAYYEYPYIYLYNYSTYPFYLGISCIIIQMIIYCVLRSNRVQQNVIQPVVGYVPPQQITITQVPGTVYYQQPVSIISQPLQNVYIPYGQPQQVYYQNNQPIANVNYQQNNVQPMNKQPVPENPKPIPQNPKPVPENQQKSENINQLKPIGSINDDKEEQSFENPK